MATSKTQYAPNKDDDFLRGIKAADNVESKRPATEPTHTAEPSTPATNDKKTLCNIKVNESTLKAWKQFCLDHDTTLTAAIKTAMNKYIQDVKSGKTTL